MKSPKPKAKEKELVIRLEVRYPLKELILDDQGPIGELLEKARELGSAELIGEPEVQ